MERAGIDHSSPRVSHWSEKLQGSVARLAERSCCCSRSTIGDRHLDYHLCGVSGEGKAIVNLEDPLRVACTGAGIQLDRQICRSGADVSDDCGLCRGFRITNICEKIRRFGGVSIAEGIEAAVELQTKTASTEGWIGIRLQNLTTIEGDSAAQVGTCAEHKNALLVDRDI